MGCEYSGASSSPCWAVPRWSGRSRRVSECAKSSGRAIRGGGRGLTDAGRGDAAIQFRFADGQFGRLPALAADLLRAQVSAFATIGDAAALAARQVTTTLPIVFTAAVDPVELGLVESISRPGLNATGLTSFGSALVPKRLSCYVS